MLNGLIGRRSGDSHTRHVWSDERRRRVRGLATFLQDQRGDCENNRRADGSACKGSVQLQTEDLGALAREDVEAIRGLG
jgi:hypothetical protein